MNTERAEQVMRTPFACSVDEIVEAGRTLAAELRNVRAELHARNVEAKEATIQAVGLRRQMADACALLGGAS